MQRNKIPYSKMMSDIQTRPNASNGFWLLALWPSVFGIVRCMQRTPCEGVFSNFELLSMTSISICLYTGCMFTILKYKPGVLNEFVIRATAITLVLLMLRDTIEESLLKYIFCVLYVTLFYEKIYITVMLELPQSFSYGEAAVLVQGVLLFMLNSIMQFFSWSMSNDDSDFGLLNRIMIFSFCCILFACTMIYTFKWFRDPFGFYTLMMILISVVIFFPITQPVPLMLLLKFILKDENRIKIIFFYFAMAVATVILVYFQQEQAKKATTRMRKWFHFLLAIVYIPGVLYQCELLYIATGVALAIFIILELVRIMDIPPFAPMLSKAFLSFSDEKDAGKLALTPFCLLIGCSIPFWIHPCPCVNINDKSKNIYAVVPLLSGVLTIGIGDTAASLVGSMFGSIKWRDSSKSLQGSLAYLVSVLTAVFVMQYLDVISMSAINWEFTIIATIATAIIEAHTNQIDNIVLPFIFYIIVSVVEKSDL